MTLPFRIHLQDPDAAPIDVQAPDAIAARKLAETRGIAAGEIRKIKLIREKA